MSRSIKAILSYSVCAVSVFYTLQTFWDLFVFFSLNFRGLINSSNSFDEDFYFAFLFGNILLLTLFMFFHSFMCSKFVKFIFTKLNIEHLYRTCYNLQTSYFLQILMTNWSSSPLGLSPVWSTNNKLLIIILQIAQLLSWFYIISMMFVLDLPEFLGIKQVYFYVNDLGNVKETKTSSACDYMQKCRHPVLMLTMTILLAVPYMTSDRLIIAFVISWYMAKFELQEINYEYVKEMYCKKKKALL